MARSERPAGLPRAPPSALPQASTSERPSPTDVVRGGRPRLVRRRVETSVDREAAIDVMDDPTTEDGLARRPRQGRLILKALQEDCGVLCHAPRKRPLHGVGVFKAAVRGFVRGKADVPVHLPSPRKRVEKEEVDAWLRTGIEGGASPGGLDIHLDTCGRDEQFLVPFEEMDLRIEHKRREAGGLRLTKPGGRPGQSVAKQAKLHPVGQPHPQKVVPAVALLLDGVDARRVGHGAHLEVVPSAGERVGTVREVGRVGPGGPDVRLLE